MFDPVRFLKKKLTLKSDLLITFLNGLAVLAGVFFLNGMIARMHGLDVLGEFSYIRRIVTSCIGVLLFGMNVGLPYFISRNTNPNYAYGAVALFICTSLPLIFFITWLINIGYFPGLKAEESHIYFLYIIGIGAQFLSYSIFRGYMNMIGANILQFLCTAVIPIIAFYYFSNLSKTINQIAIFILIISFLGYFYRMEPAKKPFELLRYVSSLFTYGFVRLPSFLAQFFLIAGLPILLAKEITSANMALLNAGISIVRLALIFVTPLGMILLPRISHALAQDKKFKVGQGMEILLTTTIYFSTIICCIVFLYTEELLILWLGQITTDGILLVKLVILAFPFYSVMGVLRGPIDAGSEKGYNSLIYVIAALGMLFSFLIFRIAGVNIMIAGTISFAFGHSVSMLGCLYFSKKLFDVSIKLVQTFTTVVLIVIMINALALVIGLIFDGPLLQLVVFLISFSVMAIMYMNYSTSDWVMELKKRI